MQRSIAPPPNEFFAQRRPPAGTGRLGIALGEIEIDIEGLDPEHARQAAERYGAWTRTTSRGDALRVRVEREDTEHFIAPVSAEERAQVLLACDGTRVRYLSYRVAGWFDTTPGGQGLMLMAQGGFEPALRSIENYVRAAVAWQAASRGGALVHAASAVFDGRGYLFYGASGAGKSTLAASNRRGTIVSDDLSLVLPDAAGAPELVGSPFRGTYEEGDPVVGSFPLVAGFRLVQAREPAVRAVSRVRGTAELVGNLPFVAEAYDVRPPARPLRSPPGDVGERAARPPVLREGRSLLGRDPRRRSLTDHASSTPSHRQIRQPVCGSSA
jgi:hypothetical protein